MNAIEQSEGWDAIDALFDVSMSTSGATVEFRIFDPQNCEHIQQDWLAAAVEKSGISSDRLDQMVKDGLVKKHGSPNGHQGYLLYSEHQADVMNKLQVSGRYTVEELRHIADDWHSYLDIVTSDELTYDSFDIDDYDHFKRRAAEMLQFFEDDLKRPDESFGPLPPAYTAKRKAEAAERVKMWRWIINKTYTCADADLDSKIQRAWRHQLFHLRWVDEWSRIMTAQQFSTQIEQGYSPEVTFMGHEWQANVTTLKDLNWAMTLDRFKATINEGNAFPLRTPDFNVTATGIEFLQVPTPASLQILDEKYRLVNLGRLLKDRGPAYWRPDLDATGRGACAECATIFERTTASRLYCKDACRNRAKSRRWRESDPERARKAQAKHYKEAYPDG